MKKIQMKTKVISIYIYLINLLRFNVYELKYLISLICFSETNVNNNDSSTPMPSPSRDESMVDDDTL